MRARTLLVLPVLLLALTGCTALAPTAPGPSASAPPIAAVPGLAPTALDPLDRDTATAEAKRLADAVQGLISPSELVYVDDHAKYTPATGEAAAFSGVIRVISLQPTDDPVVTAASMIRTLEASGWSQTRSTDQNGLTLTALVADAGSQRWLLLLGGDSTVKGQAVIDLQLASPDLP